MRVTCSRGFGPLLAMTFLSAAAGLAKDAREPKLVSVTDAQLREGSSARASRNYAWMGYNTPEIHLQLPPVDNSAYAEVTFAPAKLVDKAGRSVPHEVEQGLYSSETHSTEVRFTPKDAKPETPPVEFTRAAGTINVRYPVTARTVVVKAGTPASLSNAKVSVTGSSVVVEAQPGFKMLEVPFDSGLDEPLRVFDASGKRLAEDPSKQSVQSAPGGGSRTTLVFKGAVAEARLDAIDEWAEFEIAYDLPPGPKLPAADAGTKPPGGGVSGPGAQPAAVRRLPKRP
jgi:hypothetical protein